MIEVQKKLKDDPAQRDLPCILRGSRSKTVILFVTPNSGVVLENNGASQFHKVGDLVTGLVEYSHSDWVLETHEYTLANRTL